MKVKILQVESNDFVEALIRLGKKEEIPSFHTGWHFNFEKHIKIPNSKTFVVVAENTPTIIEGCMVFEMKNKQIPYLAYLEVAPHNKGAEKMYDYIAGCLIAYACSLSVLQGKNQHKGFLTFDAVGYNLESQKKLQSIYATKYKAKALSPTVMLIIPNDGMSLIKEYLER